MSYTNKGNLEILVAGMQDYMFVIDVEKGAIVKQVLENSTFGVVCYPSN